MRRERRIIQDKSLTNCRSDQPTGGISLRPTFSYYPQMFLENSQQNNKHAVSIRLGEG